MTMKRSTKLLTAACVALVVAIVAIGCQIKNDLASNQNEFQVIEQETATDKAVEVSPQSTGRTRIDCRYEVNESHTVALHLFIPAESYAENKGVITNVLNSFSDPEWTAKVISDLINRQYTMDSYDLEWSRGDESDSINYLTSVTAYYEL